MKAALHSKATAELTAAGDWYESQRERLGAELTTELDKALDVIGENPQTWPPWPGAPAHLNIRRFLLSRFPFALPYMVKDDRVVVLAVAHEKRNPLYWLDRAG